jgi:hypothetical protein
VLERFSFRVLVECDESSGTKIIEKVLIFFNLLKIDIGKNFMMPKVN